MYCQNCRTWIPWSMMSCQHSACPERRVWTSLKDYWNLALTGLPIERTSSFLCLPSLVFRTQLATHPIMHATPIVALSICTTILLAAANTCTIVKLACIADVTPPHLVHANLWTLDNNCTVSSLLAEMRCVETDRNGSKKDNCWIAR